jgi:hypothetical protein
VRSLAVRGGLRRSLARLHRWAGLVIMACMLVAAITGTWLVFRVEMDRLVNPHLRVVQPGTSHVSLASIVEAAERRLPNSVAQALNLQERPEDSIGVYLQSKDREGFEFDRDPPWTKHQGPIFHRPTCSVTPPYSRQCSGASKPVKPTDIHGVISKGAVSLPVD